MLWVAVGIYTLGALCLWGCVHFASFDSVMYRYRMWVYRPLGFLGGALIISLLVALIFGPLALAILFN